MDRSFVTALRDRLRDRFLVHPIGYRLWVRRNFGGGWRAARRPRAAPAAAVLLRRRQVEEAIAEVREIGLPRFGIEEKFWDALAAVAWVLENASHGEEVLDAGACLYSPILPWLSLYGYRRLHGCNLVFEESRVHGPIVYEHGDITATAYGDGRFAAITCMSVIEHGVDPTRFFAEMARILRPGGILAVSTDYWEDPIDTRGRTEFGAPVRVFSRREIPDLIDLAARSGLRLEGPLPALSCEERAVTWNGLSYTFIYFTLRKVS